MISMEQPTIIEARDTNTIMLPFVTNFNNAHPATIIIATPALASAVQQAQVQSGNGQGAQTIHLTNNPHSNVIAVSNAITQAIQQQSQPHQLQQVQVTQVHPHQAQQVQVQIQPIHQAQQAISTVAHVTTVATKAKGSKKRSEMKAQQELSLDNNAEAAIVAGLSSNAESLLACGACGKNFVSYGRLKSHEKTHSKQRPFKCNDCGKTFTVRYSLICHARVHTRERPYSCNQCGSRFSQASSLKTHQIYKHTKEFPYICKYCGRGFISPGQKHEHINRTHLKSNNGTGSGYGKRKKNQNSNNSNNSNNNNNNNNSNNNNNTSNSNNNNVNNQQQSNSNNTQNNQQNNQQQNSQVQQQNTQTIQIATTTQSTSDNTGNIVTVTTSSDNTPIVSGQLVTGSLNAISAVIGNVNSSQVNSANVQTHLSLPPVGEIIG